MRQSNIDQFFQKEYILAPRKGNDNTNRSPRRILKDAIDFLAPLVAGFCPVIFANLSEIKSFLFLSF